jgi:oligopeptide transport system substrate-binding protein
MFHHISTGNFEIGLINWRSSINDPIYTLNAFRYQNEKINFAKWENSYYQALLQQADQERNVEQRLALLASAEKILIQEIPVIPLFDELNPYIKRKNLIGILPARSGNIDFRKAYFLKNPNTKR